MLWKPAHQIDRRKQIAGRKVVSENSFITIKYARKIAFFIPSPTFLILPLPSSSSIRSRLFTPDVCRFFLSLHRARNCCLRGVCRSLLPKERGLWNNLRRVWGAIHCLKYFRKRRLSNGCKSYVDNWDQSHDSRHDRNFDVIILSQVVEWMRSFLYVFISNLYRSVILCVHTCARKRALSLSLSPPSPFLHPFYLCTSFFYLCTSFLLCLYSSFLLFRSLTGFCGCRNWGHFCWSRIRELWKFLAFEFEYNKTLKYPMGKFIWQQYEHSKTSNVA